MDSFDYYELLGTKQESEWLNSLPLTRSSVDLLLDYISHVRSEEACLHFLMWTDLLSIDTIEKLSITSHDINTVVDEIFDNFDIEFIKDYFSKSTFNPTVLRAFHEHGCSIDIEYD